MQHCYDKATATTNDCNDFHSKQFSFCVLFANSIDKCKRLCAVEMSEWNERRFHPINAQFRKIALAHDQHVFFTTRAVLHTIFGNFRSLRVCAVFTNRKFSLNFHLFSPYSYCQ